MKVKVTTLDSKAAGDITLADEVFAVEPRADIVARVVNWQLAKRRAGTHRVKSRGEIKATGAKMYRQKGTGNARHGPRSVVQFRGGGVVHGPVTRSHAHNLPKKVRTAALKSALSRRTEENAVTVFEAFELSEIKTKAFVDVMNKFEFEDLLLVLSEKDEKVIKSARNITGVKVLPVEGLNVYDILDHKNLALTSSAVDAVVARLGA